VAVETPPPDLLLQRLAARLDGDGQPLAVLDPTWPSRLRRAAHDALRTAREAGRVGDGDLVLFTSGSSGRPKGVVRTLESWRASLPGLTDITGATSADVVWLPLPLTSGLSLYGGFHAMALGAEVITTRVGDGVPPTATVAHVVPSLLEPLCRAVETGRSHLRTVVVAGAALPADVRERATAVGLDVVEYYGAAELSFVGWRRGPGPMVDFPGASVRVRDDHLWVRSPYLCARYLDPQQTGPLRWDGAWASVGDRGRSVPGGWQVLGRGDAAVTTAGHTVVAEEVEAALGALPGVVEAAVVGRPHGVLGQVVVAVVVVEDDVRRADLVERLSDLPRWARPRRWLRAEAIPRTSTGKIARARLAELAETLPALP
jgi:acyl-coenzyme A synthetase/AMP-(fatty) acid ligase